MANLQVSSTKKSETLEGMKAFKEKIKGRVVLPGDSDYDEIRKIWNAMIDRRPALIVRCAEAGDVQRSIVFARENGLELTIRGAGHNIAGNAISDGGLMIDLSTLKTIKIDSAKRRAY